MIQRSGLPLSAAVDGEVVMFHPERGAYFSLGDVGSRVWELVEQPVTMDEVCRILVEEYDVDPETCRTEVEAFVSQLLEAGLVELKG